jgi:hypothetical protein
MAKQKDHDADDKGKAKKGRSKGRVTWLDDKTDSPMIDDYASKLNSFLEAMADGRIESKELKDQEKRVVALMKKIEPELDDDMHEQVTELLCELTAYNVMHTVYEITEARPKTRFRG